VELGFKPAALYDYAMDADVSVWSRKKLITVGIVVLGTLCIAVWLATRPPEPSYKGKRVSEYVDELARTIATNRNPQAGAVYVEVKADDPRVKAIFESGPDAIPYLRRAITRRSSVRVKVTEFLRAKLPGTLGKWLRAPDNSYREGMNEACFRGLAAFGPNAKAALPELIGSFEDQSGLNMASYAVIQIGPRLEDVPRLLNLLSTSKESFARLCAAICLGRTGAASKDVVAALAGACGDQEDFVKIGSIDALRNLGRPARAIAEPVLVNMITNNSQQIRIVALWALGSVRGETNVVQFQRELESAIQRLPSDSAPLGAVSSPSTCVMLLADILSEFGEEAGSTLPVLRPLVLDNNIRVALSAARAAWKIGRETNEVFFVCERAIAHADPNLRRVGAELLSEVCAAARIPLPGEAKLLAAPDPFVRFYAARAVFKLTGDTQRTLPVIVEGLEDHFSYYRNLDIRRLAAETLGEMGTNAHPAIPCVMRALQDGEVTVRKAATNALKRIEHTYAPK